MPATSRLPHRRVDDTDNDRTLSVIDFLSASFSIEPIVTLLSITDAAARHWARPFVI
jgi:hypothetical protein